MTALEYPTAWLRVDEAAVALGNVRHATVYAYSGRDGWRQARDSAGELVYAVEDVRATARKERDRAARRGASLALPPTLPPGRRTRAARPPLEALRRLLNQKDPQ